MILFSIFTYTWLIKQILWPGWVLVMENFQFRSAYTLDQKPSSGIVKDLFPRTRSMIGLSTFTMLKYAYLMNDSGCLASQRCLGHQDSRNWSSLPTIQLYCRIRPTFGSVFQGYMVFSVGVLRLECLQVQSLAIRSKVSSILFSDSVSKPRKLRSLSLGRQSTLGKFGKPESRV